MLKAFHTVLFLFTISLTSLGQQSSTAANSDPTYKQLREITIGSESFALKDFVLKRDAGTFTFRSGNLTFLSAVNGKITGAIFAGDAIFSLAPPLGTESRMISMLSKDNGKEFVETFQEALFRFTDNTYDEIKQRATPANGVSTKLETLQKYQDYSRKTIRYNYDARILQDVLSAVPGGFFVAFINGQKYSSKLVYTIDPHGADDVAPEEVSLRTFDDMKYGIWSAFHFSNEYAKGVATGTEENSAYSIVHQDLDTAIDKNGYLRGNSLASIVSNSDSLRAVDFALFAKLRVKTVTDADGNPLSFIQEDDKHDYNYWVLLPKPLAKGEKTQIRTIYEGKDAVLDMGQGNYFPVARSTWYPNMTTMMHYATYDMKFSVPRNVQVVATGNLVNQSVVGDHAISQWKTQVPEAVAGFNLGEFKRLEAKVDRDGYTVESYANENQPNNVAALSLYHMNIGSMDTRNMMKKPLAEAQLAMDLYSYYFGPIAYKRVSMTQQTACTFGQSWPGLVYLPICSYFDKTVRHAFGLDDDRGYWTIVAPHEIAHQWWGHTVGFNSYRDQWMSEGFSDFSAALFLQLALKDNKQYLKFWKDEHDLLTEKNALGYRGIDAGPLVDGYRLANTKTGGDIPRRLIYPKGAYILHMIRMMLSDMRDPGEGAFRNFIQDFTKNYANRPATTEDFKSTLEKHMVPVMNLDGNQKMDWFFNEYVYGTALPTYKFDYSFENVANSSVTLKFKITQSNVDENFKMPVSLYLELADGRIIRLGGVPVVGNKTVEQSLPLNGLGQTPKRAMINYNYDVLATGY